MSSNRFVKGKLYKILDYVLRLILLNFLIVIPSFLCIIIYSLYREETDSILFYLALVPVVIWLFPSIVAVADVIRQYEDDQTNTIFKDFFKSFKKHFVKSFIIGAFVFILLILLYNSFTVFNTNQAKAIAYSVGLWLTVSFMIIAAFITIHIPLVLVYFTDLSIIQYIKLALIMAFKDFGRTLIMVILAIAVGVLSILSYYVMFFGAFSVLIYLIVKISFKSYIKIHRKVEKE